MREFSIVKRIIDSMRFLPNLAIVYLTIVDVVIDETEAENCSLMLLDRDTDMLIVKAAKGKRDKRGKYYDQKEYPGRGFGINEGIAGKVVKEGKPFLIADTKKEKLFIEFEGSACEIRSLLCTPIFNKDEVIGVFNLSSSRPGVFNQNDQIVLSTIANLAATTLSTTLLYEKLQKFNEKLEEKVKEKTAVSKASEQKYRALVQEANDGIFIFQDGVFKLTNGRFEEMLGCSSQDTSLKNLNMAGFVDRMEEYLQRVEGKPDKEKRSSHFEFTVTRGNGRKVEVEVNVITIEYEGNYAIQGIVRDITPRRELERSKADFLAMVAHELRTPITVITGYNRMLLKGEMGALNLPQQEILKESKKSCDRLTSFAREIIGLSRIETGKMKLNFQEEEINECINDAFRQVSTLARKKKITLEKRVSCQDLPKIALDRNRIEQVLVNLTTNAINYTLEGGKIEIAIRPPTGNFLEVWVMDNGIGVPPEEREIIFDKFRIGKRSNCNVAVGLGLAICKKIIKAHGGRIWMEPGEGGGSKFIFTLPLTRL